MTGVVIVGAGLAGLAAACHLTGRGHRVVIAERGAGPGGRAGRAERAGYRFDTGPSVLTMPQLVADTLAVVGVDMARTLPMTRLDPAYRAMYPDGSVLRVRARPADMRAEIDTRCGPEDAAAYDGFVDWLTRMFRAEMDTFIDRNYGSVLDLLTSPRALARLVALGGFRRLGPTVRRRFGDERLHRLFSFQALYAGLSPDRALALYAVITYMDTVAGVWYPAGGMHALPAALADACIAAGAQVRYDAEVTTILRRRDTGAVAGVRLTDGDTIPADAVVITSDLPVAYRQLLPGLRPSRTVTRGRYSPSAVVWHLGVRGCPDPGAAHHNIHFGTQWAEAFHQMLDLGELMADPSRLVTVPTLTDPDLAPPGGSTLFVLEPVPNLNGRVNWPGAAGAVRDRLLHFLDVAGYPTDIVTETMVTPTDWARQGLHQGTPFSLAHTFGQSGPFRPRNVEPRLPGTFFAGSGTVPGVGVPMVLISGKLAADRVTDYLGGRRR